MKEIPNVLIARSWNILLEHKGGHNPVWETEVEDKNGKLLSLLKNIPGSDDVSTEDITECMANDEVNELTNNNIAEIVTQGEVTEGGG